MKYSQILTLNESLNKINLKGAKFSFGISRNIAILKPEIESLVKATEATEEYKAYDAERIELCKKHSEKDANGEAVLENNEFKIINRKEFNKELEELNKKHQKAIDARDEQIKEVNDLLEKDTEVTLYKIKLSEVPEEITTNELRSIIDIIEE